MTTATGNPSDPRRDPRRAAVRTAWLLGAVAAAFFVAAFVLLPH
jgi:hypothetical protein